MIRQTGKYNQTNRKSQSDKPKNTTRQTGSIRQTGKYNQTNGKIQSDKQKIQSDKQKNMFTIRQTNTQTERRTERKKKTKSLHYSIILLKNCSRNF